MSKSDDGPSRSEIRGKVLHGLRWTAVVRFGTQAVSWIVTLFVIRLLQPEDYGLEAMATVSFSLLMLLSSAGIEQALIQARKLEKGQIPRVFGLLLAVSLALCAVQIGLAPLLAAYYLEPRVTLILVVLAAGFLLVPFTAIPYALLSRALDFKYRSLSELAKAATASAVTLILALEGAGVWALVIGQLAGMLGQVVFLNLVERWLCLPRFSIRGVETLVRFGGVIVVTNLVYMMCWRVDAILGGRILGPELLGVYAVALHLGSLPMEKIMPMLHQVAFPAYSRIQDRVEDVARYFLKSVRLVSLVTVPLLFGLAAVAEWAVPLILGEKWRPAVVPITVISLIIPIRAIGTMFSPVLNAIGRATTNLGNALITLCILAPAFWIGLQWGLVGLCLAWVVAYPLVFLIISRRLLRIFELGFRDLLAAMFPALLVGTTMLVLLQSLARWALGGSPPWIILAVLVPLGAAIYLGMMGAFYRDRLREARELVRARS